jgi:hypothetical protein
MESRPHRTGGPITPPLMAPSTPAWKEPKAEPVESAAPPAEKPAEPESKE